MRLVQFVVVCGRANGQAEAKISMFGAICGNLVATDQESSFERSMYTSGVVPLTVGHVFGPFNRPIRASWLAWPSPPWEPLRPRYVCTVKLCNCEVEFIVI